MDTHSESGLAYSRAHAADSVARLATVAGQLEGTVTDKEQNPVESMTVVLIPAKRNRRDLYKTVVTAAEGQFTFGDVAPGTYKLFAWEDVEPFAWFDPDFLNRYEEQGKTIVVTEAETPHVELKPIPIGN